MPFKKLLLAAAIATALSVIFGVTAGYLGGNADEGLSLVAVHQLKLATKTPGSDNHQPQLTYR